MEIQANINRNYSIDTLRSIATVLVILLHITATGVLSGIGSGNFDFSFQVSNLIDSFCRISVPLFVMISGAFLLGKDEDPVLFYRKRASKVLIPMIVWSLVYALFVLVGSRFSQGAWAINKVLFSFVNGSPYYHLWYLYMLLSLYAITPFLNILIKELSFLNIKVIALIVLILGFLNMTYDHFSGAKMFFPFWFVDYIGYYLLGFVLKNQRSYSVWKLVVVSVFSSLCIFLFTDITAQRWGDLFFYRYTTPFVILSSLCVYKIFCQVTVKENVWSKISKYSFGMYLIHPLILTPLDRYGIFFCKNIVVDIVLKFIIVFTLSLLASMVISRIKWLKKII